MRQLVAKVCIGALALIAVMAALVTSASAANVTATASRAFGGNPCNLVSASQVSVVHINAPCIRAGTVRMQIHTPLGSVRTASYKARWGGIDHSLTLVVHHLQGSAAAVAQALKYWRGAVLGNGALFSGKPLGSELLETFACVNPPTEDCTTGKIYALVGHYTVQIFLNDTAPFVGAEDPTNPAVDEAHDAAQEETVKGAFVGIGSSVDAKL